MGQLTATLCTMNKYFDDIECEKKLNAAKRSLKVKPKKCVCLQMTIVFWLLLLSSIVWFVCYLTLLGLLWWAKILLNLCQAKIIQLLLLQLQLQQNHVFLRPGFLFIESNGCLLFICLCLLFYSAI